MIKSNIDELVAKSFFSRLVPLDTNLTWRPANTRLVDYAELRLETDRKGECVKAELALRQELLTHPVLAGVCTDLIKEFAGLVSAEAAELVTPEWAGERSESKLKVGKVQIARHQTNGNQCFTVGPGPGFLAGLFSR